MSPPKVPAAPAWFRLSGLGHIDLSDRMIDAHQAPRLCAMVSPRRSQAFPAALGQLDGIEASAEIDGILAQPGAQLAGARVASATPIGCTCARQPSRPA
jgi:hypothetical protein